MIGRALGAAAIGVLLAGCASRPASYVDGVTSGLDAAAVAAGAADMIAVKAPPPGPPLALAPVPERQAGNPVTPALLNTLRARRYALADGAGEGALRVSYAVGAVEGFVVVRVAVDGWDMARAFGRDRVGRLVPAAPLFAEAPAGRAFDSNAHTEGDAP